MDSSAPIDEVFKRFILSKKALGLAEKTLESYQQHLVAIRKHLDVTMMIDDLKKSDLEAMTAMFFSLSNRDDNSSISEIVILSTINRYDLI